jgi:hypothetical protein
MTITLNFRRIADDALRLNDRVVFSFVWKWAWGNRKRREEKRKTVAISARRLQRYTGYNLVTIKHSVELLRARGYLVNDWDVAEDHPNLRPGYWKCPLHAYTDQDRTRYRFLWGINQEIYMWIRDYEDTHQKYHTANWWRKVMGVSRRTVFNWANWYDSSEDDTMLNDDGLGDEDCGNIAYIDYALHERALKGRGLRLFW